MKRISILASVMVLLVMQVQVFGFGIKDKLGIGFNVNTQRLYGDTRSGDFVFGGTPLVLRLDYTPSLFLETDLTYSKLSTRLPGNTGDHAQFINLGVKAGYRLLSDRRFNPLIYMGAGAFNFKLDNATRFWDMYGSLGAGFEYFLTPAVGLNFTGDFRYTTGDDFDGSRAAVGTDGFFNFALGLNFYLHKRSALSKKSDNSIYGDVYDISAEEATFDDLMKAEYATTTDAEEMQEITELTEEKTALSSRMEQKEEEIRLLRYKLEAVNRYEELLEDRLKITGMNPGDVGSDPVARDFKNAMVLFEAEEFEESAQALITLLKENPRDEQVSDWWYWLGENYYHIGDYDSAKKSFEWSLMTNRNHSRDEITHLMLGLSLWKSGESKQALSEFDLLLRNTADSRLAAMLKNFVERIQAGYSVDE